jgi:hypothetical protein
MSGIIGQDPNGRSGPVGKISSLHFGGSAGYVAANNLRLQGTTVILAAGESGFSVTDDANARTEFKIDANGAITQPSQPAFCATLTGQNPIPNSFTDIAFTEIFDQSSDASSPSFEAPVTGRYLFNFQTFGYGVTAGDDVQTKLVTSNRSWIFLGLRSSNDTTRWMASGSVLTDMDDCDTAKLQIINGDAARGEMSGSVGYSFFSGHLVA